MNFVTFERRALVSKKKKPLRTTFNLERVSWLLTIHFYERSQAGLQLTIKKLSRTQPDVSCEEFNFHFLSKLSPKVDFLLKVLGIIPWDI